jgi:hypothetical protein
MKEEKDSLTIQGVKEHLRRWPVVVVTREENKLLKDDPRRDPDQRYRDVGIEVLERTESGEWEPRRPQNHISD